MLTDDVKYPNVQDIDTTQWCSELECTSQELLYCISRVGTSWICVEAFWTMNRDRIRASFDPDYTLPVYAAS